MSLLDLFRPRAGRAAPRTACPFCPGPQAAAATASARLCNVCRRDAGLEVGA